ncbi:MAG: dienelactone hydrolase family protein [Beijerinckiaceae bacterium]
MSQQLTPDPASRAAERTLTLEIGGRHVPAYANVHDSGSGPGLLLVGDRQVIDESLRAKADLFAEEGYSVLATGCELSAADVAGVAEALRGLDATDAAAGGIGCIGYGAGGALALKAAAQAGFRALAAYDAMFSGSGEEACLLALPCPFILHFGTRDAPQNAALAQGLRAKCNGRKDGSRIYAWVEGAPEFAMPGRPACDAQADELAHTRTLELMRRVLGPHYDFAELFAQHLYHEFETRDVDATMATMIGDPYVNHVPTLSGGVGHDMLKRFYKYHFVEQNTAVLERATISSTCGANRLVIETYSKFRHDAEIDRYFPGLKPTGKVVELALVIVVKFRGDKVCHEHLHWDQGSALKQIGALDAGDLPLAGPEAARKFRDITLPSNIFMQDAWAKSEGKTI